MEPDGLNVKSNALHGEKVGVGTLLASKQYYSLKENKSGWKDYSEIDSDYIKNMFGDKLSSSIIKENLNDCAKGITAKDIERNWDKICDVIDTVPTYSELIDIYKILGVKSGLCDIDVSEEKLNLLLEYSPLVRNRLTLMRLQRVFYA